MKKVLSVVLLALTASSAAFGVAVAAPEIDASSATSAVALLSGALVMLRSRRKS